MPDQPTSLPTASLPVTWRVGEHIAAVGDTGTGKTYLVSRLVAMREYVVVLRTKPDDIRFEGFRRVKRADAMDDVYQSRILLVPDHSKQVKEAYAMLDRVWEQGGWTVVIDELWYVEKLLKLGPWVERLLTQGRSKKISVVVGMQRPAQISRFAISQCTHLFTFRVEGRDLQTIKESTTPRIVEPIATLGSRDPSRKHNFVYYNRSTREIAIGDAKKLDRVITGGTQSTPQVLDSASKR
jgi:hypothetical protein